MPVSTPRGEQLLARLFPAVAATLLAILVVVAPAQAATAPKILKKATVVAPINSSTLDGTVSGSLCRLSFPVAARKVTVTVRGPLGKSKVKSTRLKLKRKSSRRYDCTWKTKSFRDGRYEFKAVGTMRVKRKNWRTTMRRTVNVNNSVVRNAGAPREGVGNARFITRLTESWNPWILGADPTRKAWINRHFWGVISYSPFFDGSLEWAPPTLVYKDLYAIYRDDAQTLAQHPDWVLKDGSGNPLYIDWGCNPGPCPQYAGDVGSPAFRAAWIADAKSKIAKGYKGLWIDDANMEIRVGNERGEATVPVDPRTGQTMTFANWRRYVAEFLEEIRREIPNAELVANVLWFGGTSVGRDADKYVTRAYSAVDRLNLERGFNDDGLTAGSYPQDIWSVDTFMQFIDRMHARGLPVTLDSAWEGKPAWEYNLAGFFLVDQGQDAVGEMALKPGEWWAGWDVQLGAPLGPRTRRGDGVFQRRFQKGLVLLNPTRASTKTVELPSAYKRIDGGTVRSVTLSAGRGAVLLTP